MTDFDQGKALREELRALADVDKAIRGREYVCEGQISQAELELNALRKIRGFVRIQIDAAKARLAKLEQER